MKKIQVLVAALFMSAIVFSQKTINDPNAEPRSVGSFHAIKISNAFDVYISQSSQDAVAVSASKTEYRDKIVTKVENGVLIIKFDEDKKFWKSLGGDKTKLKAYISIKKIDR